MPVPPKPEGAFGDSTEHLKKLTSIGLALSAQKNIEILFEMIVDEARSLANADAGTLYIVSMEEKTLRFKILQNETLNIRMGGGGNGNISLPDVPLYIGGEPNYSNVSSFSALMGMSINIPDVYDSDAFDFEGPRRYDRVTGYRSGSMLVIPMKNHVDDVIGVLQLLNAKEPETGEVVPFREIYVELIASLASQAAVALTNTHLIQGMKDFFYSFIESIAAAIDEKSPYTGGHIKRGVELTMMIADVVNRADTGLFKDCYFDEDMLEELRLAAWMHDIGKITTPEYLMDKSSKLQTIFDCIGIIDARFRLIAKNMENTCLKKKIELIKEGRRTDEELRKLDTVLSEQQNRLFGDLEFIRECNHGREFMSVEKVERLIKLAERKYETDEECIPYLEEWELKNLCALKGTLNDDERRIIENHALMTLKMLSPLPFPKNLSNVPEFAAAHHEKLDGSGYPRRLKGPQITLQSRIIAIADIFEALTAKDRPYRKAMDTSKALEIMNEMKECGHIDPDLFNLLVESGIFGKI